MVNSYAGGAVMVARSPFTPEQGEQLIQIIAHASKDYLAGGNTNLSTINWSKVEEEARDLLTPWQFELLATMEPPLPNGGRYQTQLYRWADEAMEKETVASVETAASTALISPGPSKIRP